MIKQSKKIFGGDRNRKAVSRKGANYKLDRRKETGKRLANTEVVLSLTVRMQNTEVVNIGHLKANNRKTDKECSSMIVDLKFLKSKAEKSSLQG